MTVTGLLLAESDSPEPFAVAGVLITRFIPLGSTDVIFVPAGMFGPLMFMPASTALVLAQVTVVPPLVVEQPLRVTAAGAFKPFALSQKSATNLVPGFTLVVPELPA